MNVNEDECSSGYKKIIKAIFQRDKMQLPIEKAFLNLQFIDIESIKGKPKRVTSKWKQK